MRANSTVATARIHQPVGNGSPSLLLNNALPLVEITEGQDGSLHIDSRYNGLRLAPGGFELIEASSQEFVSVSARLSIPCDPEDR